jgi:hypothetical protein
MNTLDGTKLVQDRLAKQLAQYPAGSVTPRTIVATLSVSDDPEKTFNEVNAVITSKLITIADAVHTDNTKLRSVKLSNEEIDNLTTEIVNSVQSLEI